MELDQYQQATHGPATCLERKADFLSTPISNLTFPFQRQPWLSLFCVYFQKHSMHVYVPKINLQQYFRVMYSVHLLEESNFCLTL